MAEPNKSEFETLLFSQSWLGDLQDEVVQHSQSLLAGTTSFLRENYRELAQLTLVLLGAAPSQPGSADQAPNSNARWMAKVQTVA